MCRTAELQRKPAGIRRLLACSLALALGAAGATTSADGAHDSTPPGYTVARSGDRHDFDYFEGGWTTRQRRLRARGVGSNDEPSVVGGFQGRHGEFYGEDQDSGRPVKVRFTWDKLDADHARWQQAFSYDDRTWETNWTADFVRAAGAATCAGGRPQH